MNISLNEFLRTVIRNNLHFYLIYDKIVGSGGPESIATELSLSSISRIKLLADRRLEAGRHGTEVALDIMHV